MPTPEPDPSQALSLSGPSAHLPCAPSSVPGVRPRADIPGSLPFASQDFKSRREFWRPRVPSGNLGLGLTCGLGWVTSPIMLTQLLLPRPTALIRTLQPSHPLYSPHTYPHPPPHLPSPYPSCNPSNPPVLIHPSLYTPHSLIFSAGAHSSSDSSPFRVPGGQQREEAVVRVPEHLGVWLASHKDPSCVGPASSPQRHTFGVLALLHSPFVIRLLLLGAAALLFGFL